MNTYIAEFCRCGRIHIYPNKDIDWMSEDYKHRTVIQVCKNCGTVFQLFLTENSLGGKQPSFDINGCDVLIDQDIDPDSNNKHRIHINNGITVPMRDGNYANYYWKCRFQYIDPETPFANDESCLVDKERLISDIRKKYQDELESDDINNIIKAIEMRRSNIIG